MSTNPVALADRSIRKHLVVAALSSFILAAGAGGLAAGTKLAGAVIATGTLVVDSSVKKVQHPSGGVVANIFARDGMRVKAGDILLSLDPTVTRANLAIVNKSLQEFEARCARLEAERDGNELPDFSTVTAVRGDPGDAAKVVAGEQSLFELRRQARMGQKVQLHKRISELEQQIAGITEQLDANQKETVLIGTELESIRVLWKQKLISMDRMTSTEREAVRLEGEHGRLTASAAQARGQIAEIDQQIIQIDQDMRSQVANDLRDTLAKIAEAVERKVTAEDALRHIDLRSPQDGIVDELSVHTVGGVISPGETVMIIVPTADELTVEARIAPQDIDQVEVGQKANLRMSAFSRQTTPVLEATLTRVSADLQTDQKTGAGYYSARLAIPPHEEAKLEGLKMTPGMPVEVYLSTGDRTVLSYLFKPLTDQAERAFKED